MIISNNVNLNTIDKAYNVFSNGNNLINKVDDKTIEKNISSVSQDINFNLNDISKKENVNSNVDINSLLKDVKLNIENADNADIFSGSLVHNISDLLD